MTDTIKAKVTKVPRSTKAERFYELWCWDGEGWEDFGTAETMAEAHKDCKGTGMPIRIVEINLPKIEY